LGRETPVTGEILQLTPLLQLAAARVAAGQAGQVVVQDSSPPQQQAQEYPDKAITAVWLPEILMRASTSAVAAAARVLLAATPTVVSVRYLALPEPQHIMRVVVAQVRTTQQPEQAV
jgi:hypothetical protein